jgi:outer membrane protein assembly factor BamB
VRKGPENGGWHVDDIRVLNLILSIASAVGILLSTAITGPAAPAAAHPTGATPQAVRSVITPNGAWTVYHHDNAHTGLDSTQGSATGASTSWVSPTLNAQVYGEPLVYDGLVYVATSNNTVYALNQSDGTVVWSKTLGAPQTSGWQCGNVNPTGILGTGVIDAAASRIYEVAFLHQFLSYYLYGFDLATGNIVQTTQIKPTGFDWTDQQERGALALSHDGTQVYVPFGGRAGDCGPYHGWVVGVPTAGGLPDELYKTPSTASGIWAAGGVVVDDATGNVFFATGNAIPCSGAINSDSVIRTSATLASPTFFQPQDWSTHWCNPDSDLGSATPVLISASLMFTAGKYGQGFLLNPANLGGLNGQLFPARTPYVGADVCGGIHSDATFGSFAYAAPRLYLECESGGLVSLQVNTAAPSFSLCGSTCTSPSWRAGGSTTFGPPIVAGGAVWVVDIGGSGLYGYDATTGAQIYHSSSFGVTHFSTPSEAGGQMFVSAGTVVRSFNLVLGCRAITAGASPLSPSTTGTPVAIIGAASGCPNPNPQYEFWVRYPGAACCQLAQPYSTSATYNWPTTGLTSGTYTFAVWARDANSSGAFGNGLGRYDAAASLTYVLSPLACTGVTASASPPTTAGAGTPVSITGVASTCPNPRYQFWVLYPQSQTWQRAQAYSSNGTFNWNTTNQPAGAYNFSIWARDASSSGTSGNVLGTWDATTTLHYTLTPMPCTGITASFSPSGTAIKPAPVAITGMASGCLNPQYEFWILYPSSQTWQLAQGYPSGATFNWSTTNAPIGTYHFSIWARDASSSGTSGNVLGRWDAYVAITYLLT